MTDERQFCTFHLGDLCFGVDVLRVQEIIREQAMTRVPSASRVVRGLINLRGQIVTALDLRRRLDLPDRPANQPPFNVVVQTDDGAVSLLVDQIGDVLSVHDRDFEPPPEILRGTARELIRGAYKLNGRLLLILDPDRTVTLTSDGRGDNAPADRPTPPLNPYPETTPW
ncbi:MAG TPA: chemotaxis protein CheW [Fimbriiglobus sp.]